MHTTSRKNQSKKVAGVFGLSAVLIFIVSLITFGNLNPTFNFVDDFVSKLGAKGEPMQYGGIYLVLY